MNYKKIYDDLIEKCRGTIYEGYTETHHIIPVCMGGTDTPDNLVIMSAEQHFVAHKLLAKIHKNVSGLWLAIQLMSSAKTHRIGNKKYAYIKKNMDMSMMVKNAKSKKYGYESYLDMCADIWGNFYELKLTTKQINAKIGIPINQINLHIKYYVNLFDLHDEEKGVRFFHRSQISKNIRANITPEQEEYRIRKCKEADYSKCNRRDISGDKNPGRLVWINTKEVFCPHCGIKKKDSPNFRRYHFNNCKKRKV